MSRFAYAEISRLLLRTLLPPRASPGVLHSFSAFWQHAFQGFLVSYRPLRFCITPPKSPSTDR